MGFGQAVFEHYQVPTPALINLSQAMVLGMKSKHKKGVPVKVDYIVHVQEIRPWPPSESLKSVQTVVLQYENSNHNSGSFLSVAGDSNIVFNESFILPIIFYKKPNDKFKKNYLEFSLVEPRKDKAKEQVLGTAILNLADYGVIEDILSINAPLNIKKSSNSISVQPALFITLELIEKNGGSNSSPSVGLSNEAYLDYEDGDDESEVTSYTDDDASSHSSRTFEATMVSPSRSEKNGYYANAATDSSPDTWRKVKNYASAPKFTERSMSYVKKNSVTPLIKLSPSSMSFRDTNGRFNNIVQRSAEDKSFARYAPEILSADIGWEALSEDATKRHGTMRSDTLVPNRKGPAVPPSGSNKSRLNHVMSVQIHDSGKGRNGFVDIPNGSQNKGKLTAQTERKEAKGDLADSKNEWKTRVDMLEEELREVAAIEVGLYSVVAEHASSENKVHAPARRLSRFYTNACRARSQAKRASAARAAVSGLVLVAKSCGNDVTRLTFWLSNSIMLRAIVSQTAAEIEHCNGPGTIQVDLGEHSKPTEDYDDCEDVLTFIIALERVESWLFSRIVESVWWQTFTPHMQPAVGKCSGRKTSSGRKKTTGRKSNLGNNEQGNFSIELWRKAFKDACERLCPMRAGGHECGCLSPLVRLVMEQLVNRLDVAMFNAILRDSAQEMPTDPVSDPITNSKVLPIPAGKSSFSAGAQLKNAIGIWSRWLSDLSGLEDNSDDDSIALGNGHRPKSFKAFRFLHELSNLMMLPFGMLDDASTRKEVCPALAVSIIKRVANSFVPDDFCPDPIPRTVIDALDSEEITDAPGDTVTTIPCTASPTKYSPPPAALLSCVAEVGSQELKSSRLVPTLKKSYTSDDDLDELDSTLTSIVPDSYQTSSALAKLSLMPKHKGGRIVVRYGLLREIWRDDE